MSEMKEPNTFLIGIGVNLEIIGCAVFVKDICQLVKGCIICTHSDIFKDRCASCFSILETFWQVVRLLLIACIKALHSVVLY